MADTILVAVRAKGRRVARVLEVSGGTFDAMKTAVKATGARFDTKYRRWDMPSVAAVNSLRDKGFTLKAADLFINYAGEIVLRANNTMVWTPSFTRQRAEMDSSKVLARLVAAYNVSDAEFERVLDTL